MPEVSVVVELKVTVEDGEVTSAVITKGGNGIKKGSEAPDYLQLTINDVIDRANDTTAAQIDVDWPADQDWPNTVAVDQMLPLLVSKCPWVTLETVNVNAVASGSVMLKSDADSSIDPPSLTANDAAVISGAASLVKFTVPTNRLLW